MSPWRSPPSTFVTRTPWSLRHLYSDPTLSQSPKGSPGSLFPGLFVKVSPLYTTELHLFCESFRCLGLTGARPRPRARVQAGPTVAVTLGPDGAVGWRSSPPRQRSSSTTCLGVHLGPLRPSHKSRIVVCESRRRVIRSEQRQSLPGERGPYTSDKTESVVVIYPE